MWRIRPMMLAIFLLCISKAHGQGNNDWLGLSGGQPNEFWIVGANWSLLHEPRDNAVPSGPDETARHLASATGSSTVRKEPGTNNDVLLGFLAETITGQSRTLVLGLAGDSGAVFLTTSGDAYHTGAGTYTIQIVAPSWLNVGNAASTASLAHLYGFGLEPLDNSASASASILGVSGTLGYGPVVIHDANLSIWPINVTSDAGAGDIDCGFDDGSGVDPITFSPWEIDRTATDANDLHELEITNIRNIKRVGDWDFIPSAPDDYPTTVQITCNTFEMYETDGQVQIFRTIMRILDGEFTPGPTLASPRMTFGGSSKLLYHYSGLGADGNRIFMNPASESTALDLELSGTQSLWQPAGVDDEGCSGPGYPAEPVPQGQMTELHFQFGQGTMSVASRVADEALPFDLALVRLFIKLHASVEAFTPDLCNVQFIDFIFPEGYAPTGTATGVASCQPVRNRCAKYWDDLLVTDLPNELAFHDDETNHVPEYTPSFDDPEAYYFCSVDGHQSNTNWASNSGEQRIYARDVAVGGNGISTVDESVQRVIRVALTRYMDANADFDVDLHDFARFQNGFSGSGNVTWDALADYATPDDGEVPYPGYDPDEDEEDDPIISPADCDSDLYDYAFFYGRWQVEIDETRYPCDEGSLPTGNDSVANSDPDIVVCGGPLHVRPGGTSGGCTLEQCLALDQEDACEQLETCPAPPLDCPNCELYGYGECREETHDRPGGGGGDSFMGGGGGGESDTGGDDDAAPTMTAAQMAAHLLNNFSHDFCVGLAEELAGACEEDVTTFDAEVGAALAAALGG